MAVEKISSFVTSALANIESRWTSTGLASIAGLSVPDIIMGGREVLLRADIHQLWAQWFLESLCDPEPFVRSPPGYPFIFAEVTTRLRSILVGVPKDECESLARTFARIIYAEVIRRHERGRDPIDRETRHYLLDLSGPTPFCSICGYRFTRESVEKFLGEGNEDPQLPEFVDFMKPQGLKRRDLHIEVDHIIPVASGGGIQENLQLACGWCNAAKGARSSLYDVGAQPRVIVHPRLGEMTVPRPFWVIRILAIRRRCEWEDGCPNTVVEGPLTVRPTHPMGALNPTNLKITCADHDPVGSVRFVSRNVAEKIWKKTKGSE